MVVMVSILDFESSDPSSNLGRTLLFFNFRIKIFLKILTLIKKTNSFEKFKPLIYFVISSIFLLNS